MVCLGTVRTARTTVAVDRAGWAGKAGQGRLGRAGRAGRAGQDDGYSGGMAAGRSPLVATNVGGLESIVGKSEHIQRKHRRRIRSRRRSRRRRPRRRRLKKDPEEWGLNTFLAQASILHVPLCFLFLFCLLSCLCLADLRPTNQLASQPRTRRLNE